MLTDNAFIANREQVKYVGTRNMEWSHEGRGNFWSDHPAFDLNGDGIADSFYRPNDLMDQILWSQPAASLLIGSPCNSCAGASGIFPPRCLEAYATVRR